MLIATSPRRSSDQEKKSSEEPYPVDVDCNSSKCKYGISSGKSGDMAFEEHSRQPESAYKYMTERIKTKERKELFDNHQTLNQSSVHYNSVKSRPLQNNTQHHKIQAKESQGEDFIYYVQHAEAPSEELDTSLKNSARTDEFSDFLQTTTVESHERNLQTLNGPLEVPHQSVQMTTEVGNTLQSSNAKLKHQRNTLQIPTCTTDKLCQATNPLELDEVLESSHFANVQKAEPFSQCVAVESQEHLTTSLVSSSQSVIVDAEENVTTLPVTFPQSVTFQSEENVTSSMVTYSQSEIVQSEEPLTSLHSLIVQPQELVTSLQSLIVQSNEPFTSSKSLIAQSNEPVTFPKSVSVWSDKLCTPSQAAAVQSKELFKSSHATAVQSWGPLTSSKTEPFQSNGLLTSSHTAAVQPKYLCTSSKTAALQSNEITESLTSVHKRTIQSEDSMMTVETAPSEELCSKIQMFNPMSVNALNKNQSEWPYVSAETSTDYQEEVNRPLQTSTAQREEFDDLINTASLKPMNLSTLKTALQVQEDHNSQEEIPLNDLYLRRQTISNQLDGLNQTLQSAVVPEKCCLSKSIMGKMDETGNSEQIMSSIFAEPCMKFASTDQSQAICRLCDSQCSDRVTANTVAVGGDLKS